ncbi:MAG: hypothetical protein NC543_03210 [bacterium]|nr:hypothetical protein [bacterium]MCM1373935.1 hypothetical protein [Muribaculum sp.]
MGKHSFKQLLRSTAVILAFLAVLVDLLMGGANFDKTGGVAPLNDKEPYDYTYN